MTLGSCRPYVCLLCAGSWAAPNTCPSDLLACFDETTVKWLKPGTYHGRTRVNLLVEEILCNSAHSRRLASEGADLRSG